MTDKDKTIEIKEIIKKLEGLQRSEVEPLYDDGDGEYTGYQLVGDFMGEVIDYNAIQLLIIELKEKL